LLWQHESVTFDGRFHHLDHVGINPLPARVIPLWLGGAGRRFVAGPVFADRVLDRIGRIADGWMAGGSLSGEELDERWSAIRAGAISVGRDPDALGLQLLVEVAAPSDLDGLLARLAEWHSVGVTHLNFHVARRTRNLDEHLRLLETIDPFLDEARSL
jgi:alkanesulfonate monooxygenase SsuD/methylene tetrahydromethanopterin reductase-like flavin-dependent oxidoreductase (luciferase family)